MTPIPYDATGRTTPTGQTIQFACPDCSQNLVRPGAAIACPECGYVPRQGAD
jgi:predicted RNA-binding Zn-ribbon protein involved in translation (DUF1610 family)